MNNTNSDLIDVWITKYALTQGVWKRKAYICSDDKEMIAVHYKDSSAVSYYHGDDWHRTRKAAIAHAETMRAAKLVSLRKILHRLTAMGFTAPE